jgi:hypothetical protein
VKKVQKEEPLEHKRNSRGSKTSALLNFRLLQYPDKLQIRQLYRPGYRPKKKSYVK